MTEEFLAGWTRALLKGMEAEENRGEPDRIMACCSDFHYRYNQMDAILDTFSGDVTSFLAFLEGEWDWRVQTLEDGKVFLVDENKTECVCPVVQKLDATKVSPAICLCSAGFARKMFRKVLGCEVTAEVVSSIVGGDAACIYRVEVLDGQPK